MTHEEALAKAVKLLRLATHNSNPHEAALAAGRAQEIIDRFKLGNLSLDYEANGSTDEPIKDFGFAPLDPESRQHATWRSRLASTVAKHNQCKLYRQNNGTLALVGRPSDVTTVRYLFAWLLREVEALAGRDCPGTGRTFTNNYRIGCVETVCDRLQAQRMQTQETVKAEAAVEVAAGNQFALMRVQSSIVKMEKRLDQVNDWAKKNMNLRSGGSYRMTYHDSGRNAGRRAGHEVRIQPTRASVTG